MSLSLTCGAPDAVFTPMSTPSPPLRAVAGLADFLARRWDAAWGGADVACCLPPVFSLTLLAAAGTTRSSFIIRLHCFCASCGATVLNTVAVVTQIPVVVFVHFGCAFWRSTTDV